MKLQTRVLLPLIQTVLVVSSFMLAIFQLTSEVNTTIQAVVGFAIATVGIACAYLQLEHVYHDNNPEQKALEHIQVENK